MKKYLHNFANTLEYFWTKRHKILQLSGDIFGNFEELLEIFSTVNSPLLVCRKASSMWNCNIPAGSRNPLEAEKINQDLHSPPHWSIWSLPAWTCQCQFDLFSTSVKVFQVQAGASWWKIELKGFYFMFGDFFELQQQLKGERGNLGKLALYYGKE